MGVVRGKDAPSYEVDKGVRFQDLVVKTMGSLGIGAALATYAPSALSPGGVFNSEASMTVLEGEGYLDVLGKRYKLGPADTAHVPAQIPHRVVNASRTERMVLLCVYGTVGVKRYARNDVVCMGSDLNPFNLPDAE